MNTNQRHTRSEYAANISMQRIHYTPIRATIKMQPAVNIGRNFIGVAVLLAIMFAGPLIKYFWGYTMSNDPRALAIADFEQRYKRVPDGACFHGPSVVQVYSGHLNVYYMVDKKGNVYDPQVD